MNNIVLNGSKTNKLSKYSFISGYVGAICIILSSYIGYKLNIIDDKIKFLSINLSQNFIESSLLIIGTIGIIMFIVELANRKITEKQIISISNRITNKKYLSFAIECLMKYILDLLILFIIFSFYKYANEYGYINGNTYYEAWFTLLKIIVKGYIVFGLLYIILTRLLQYDPEADKKDPSYLAFKTIMKILNKTPIKSVFKKINFLDYTNDKSFNTFTYLDKTNLLGVFVKMFFIPLITVFFISQYEHLVSNWGYLENLFKNNTWKADFSINDLHNISFSIIFSIDVGIAWVGYVISSRWIRNSNISTEPTFLGWFVALACYPPFQSILSTYFSVPSETSFFTIPNIYLVSIFTIMSILSYTIYMSATMYFGIRFSNLTHRGIISKGPYSIVRHPAYASKNFSWWCVMLPAIIYKAATEADLMVLVQIFGLLFMTFFYYNRAMTEERHLRMDPEYIEYCKKVPYKFIPKVF